jgi:hypothetical protein
MNADPSAKASSASGGRTGRVECSFDNDPRLHASVEAIMAHAARRAGLPEDFEREVGAAAADASREMAASANGKASNIRLVVDEYADRVEVTFGSAAHANCEGIRQRLESKLKNRIRCEAHDGRVRVTLLKAFDAAKSGSAC